MDPISIASYGMFAAQQRFGQAAEQVARAGGGESIDLAQAAVELANAKTALKANVEVMRTADEMLGVILNIST